MKFVCSIIAAAFVSGVAFGGNLDRVRDAEATISATEFVDAIDRRYSSVKAQTKNRAPELEKNIKAMATDKNRRYGSPVAKSQG